MALERLLAPSGSPEIGPVEEALRCYYANPGDYPAFRVPSFQRELGAPVLEAVKAVVAECGSCRVLEVGAGKSGFGRELGGLRERVTWTAQDVTAANREYLKGEADQVHIGDVLDLDGPFDVIFSFYVFEHITRPEETFKKLLEALPPGGKLFVFCPRYDAPFYLSHSCDHYPPGKRFGLGLYVCWHRVLTLVLRRPTYLVHLDPAILHLPYGVDRDAVHWVSRFSLALTARRYGRVAILRYPSSGFIDWVGKTFLQIAIEVTRK